MVSQLKELQNGCDSWKVQENAGVLPISLLSVQGEMDQLLEEPPTQEVTDGILDFYFTVRDFLNISELVDENYVVYTAFRRRWQILYEAVLRQSCGKSAEMSG